MNLQIPVPFFLVCGLILGLSVFLRSYFYSKTESFVSVPERDIDIQLQACPSGTTSFSEMEEINCCDGDIVDNRCNGRKVCSVSTEKPQLPSCVNLLRNQLRDKAIRFCPPTLPNYFENQKTNKKGCTDDRRTQDGTAPFVSTQKTCTIYSTFDENQNKLDSCSNIKQRDLFKCPNGEKATLISPKANLPALVQCSFTSSVTPQPLTCFSDESYLAHLNAGSGSWRGTLSNEAKLAFCSNAKRYYIDRSLSEADLLFIDGPFINIETVKKCPAGMTKGISGSTCFGPGKPTCALYGNPSLPRC